MRATYKSRLLLGACTFALLSAPALAADVTISDEVTDPVATSTVDGGASGDILIDSDGAVNVESGTAVTIDSNNSVTNEGQVTVDDTDDATLVYIEGGFTGDFTNNLIMNSLADDIENAFTGKYGIHLVGPGVMTGNISTGIGSSIRIGGNDSFGIALETGLDGDFINMGALTVSGQNNTAIWIGDDITGIFSNRATVNNQVVVYDLDDSTDELEFMSTNSGVMVGGSIGGGFLNDGATYEELLLLQEYLNDDDPDNDDDIDTSIGIITSTGAPNTVWISPELNANGPADITLGPITSKGDGQGFINLGTISASSVNVETPIDVTAIRIEGYNDGTAYSVDLAGGFRNDGTIRATGISSDSFGLLIGEDVSVPQILNNGTIAATSSGTDDTYEVAAVKISTTADSVEFINLATISAQGFAESGTTHAVLDTTGAIHTFTNYGAIASYDATLNSNNTRVNIAGTAIDLSANTTGIDFTNEILAINDDTDSAATITGDILLGSGSDNVWFNSGTITGNIDLGMGADYFFLGEESEFNGYLISDYGTASADILGAMGTNSASAIMLDTLTIGGTSVIELAVNPADVSNAAFEVGTSATVGDGVTFNPVFESIATSDTVYTIVGGAGTVSLTGGIGSLVLGETPYAYNAALEFNAGDLELIINPKTAEDLGLNDSLTTFYDPLRESMNNNAALITSFHNITEQREFERVLNGALPDDTNATFSLSQLAFRNIATSVTGASLVSARRYRTGQFWAVENVFSRDQSATSTARGYTGGGFQMAAGYEVTNGLFDQLGAGVALSSVSKEPEGSESEPYKSWTTWFLGYGVTSFDRLTIKGLYGYGMSENRSNRILTVRGARYEADADWDGTQMGAYLEAKYRLGADDLYIDPYVSYTYISIDEDAYAETGDDGLILRGSSYDQSGAVSEIGTTFGMETQSKRMFFTTEFKLGYRDASIDDAYSREYQFYTPDILNDDGSVATAGFNGTPFTLNGPEEDGGAAIVGLSVFGEANLTKIGFAYEGAFGDNGDDHRLMLVLKWRF